MKHPCIQMHRAHMPSPASAIALPHGSGSMTLQLYSCLILAGFLQIHGPHFDSRDACAGKGGLERCGRARFALSGLMLIVQSVQRALGEQRAMLTRGKMARWLCWLSAVLMLIIFLRVSRIFSHNEAIFVLQRCKQAAVSKAGASSQIHIEQNRIGSCHATLRK